MLQTFQLYQHIREATRVDKTRKSCLDHVVTNSKLEPIKTSVLCFPVADHLPTLTFWQQNKPKGVDSEFKSFQRIIS